MKFLRLPRPRLWPARQPAPSVEATTPAPFPAAFISASAVGDYLYCARAYRLRQLGQQSSDPLAAMLAAQGVAKSAWPPAVARSTLTEAHRQAELTAGIRAHHHHDRRRRLAADLQPVALLLLALALGCGLLALWLR